MVNISKLNGKDLICESCGREYTYYRSSTQGTKIQNKGHTSIQCNTCCQAKRRKKRRQQILDHAGGKCQLCGYDICSKALSFHHKDPRAKEFPIAGSGLRSWEKVREEIDKCILVCMNCHAEIHDGMHPEMLENLPAGGAIG